MIDAPRDTTGPETGALPIKPRFNAGCPPSPAADILNGQIAGTSTTAMTDVEEMFVQMRDRA
jgi:hypothetical protein